MMRTKSKLVAIVLLLNWNKGKVAVFTDEPLLTLICLYTPLCAPFPRPVAANLVEIKRLGFETRGRRSISNAMLELLHKQPQNPRIGDANLVSAAFILIQVATIASNEINETTRNKRTLVGYTLTENIVSCDGNSNHPLSDELIDVERHEESLGIRGRSISLSSTETKNLPLRSPPSSPCIGTSNVPPSEILVQAFPPIMELIPSSPPITSRKKAKVGKGKIMCVGQTTPHRLKGVLHKKFSWKNFHELEDFLVLHRDEYFQHSCNHNYSATQKEYNNALTNELLDLASGLGYTFEEFTFAEIRDRIRCYYKSYLQALKKQRKKFEPSQKVDK